MHKFVNNRNCNKSFAAFSSKMICRRIILNYFNKNNTDNNTKNNVIINKKENFKLFKFTKLLFPKYFYSTKKRQSILEHF